MKPLNSKIPMLQVSADAEKVSPSAKTKAEVFQLKRSISGIRIPDGTLETLEAGMEAHITQALGSSFTIAVASQLYRVDGEDGDALNQAPRPMLDPDWLAQPVNRDTITQVLKTCYDPEIPLNLLDLGLIYHIDLQADVSQVDVSETADKTPHDNLHPPTQPQHRVNIEMTLTNPGCGMGDVLIQDIKRKLLKLPTVSDVAVKLVFSPPWSRDKISTAGQLALGLL